MRMYIALQIVDYTDKLALKIVDYTAKLAVETIDLLQNWK